jgi:hypothetical protein
MAGRPTTRRRLISAFAALVAVIVVGAAAYFLWAEVLADSNAPPFRVIMIKPGRLFAEQQQEAADAGGKVPPEIMDLAADQASLQMGDVKRNPKGAGFLALLRKLPGQGDAIDQDVVFRVRDGGVISAGDGDALAGDNSSVFVVPKDIVKLFDTPQDAYLQIRLRVSGLQP